ncbi:unnamed protein product [Pleuronectes platessa]|uniref:Uncharacterized protein n=1 Tax=Pleuronectes platessa TaxID=8262 RepID=A0A9N7VS04_PLEPL|nr:unnamed protein product [Pleuronectes platessa]
MSHEASPRRLASPTGRSARQGLGFSCASAPVPGGILQSARRRGTGVTRWVCRGGGSGRLRGVWGRYRLPGSGRFYSAVAPSRCSSAKSPRQRAARLVPARACDTGLTSMGRRADEPCVFVPGGSSRLAEAERSGRVLTCDQVLDVDWT